MILLCWMTFSVEGLLLFVMQFNIFPLIIPKYHVFFFYNLWSVKKIIDLILNKHSFHTYQPDLLTQSEVFFFHGNPTFLLFQLTCRPL